MLALPGCAVEAVFEPPAAREPDSLLDYRQLVIASEVIKTVRKTATGPIEIGGLRRSIGPQPGVWMTCLRSWQNGRQTHIAVFFRNNAIVESRGGVMLDNCEQESFAPLTTSAALY